MKEINEDHVFNGQLKVQQSDNTEVSLNEIANSISAVERPYKVYTAIINAPSANVVATVLENTLGGTPVWSHIEPSAGINELTLTGAFPAGKTITFVGSHYFQTSDESWIDYITWRRVDDNKIRLEHGWNNSGALSGMNTIQNLSVEVRVYP